MDQPQRRQDAGGDPPVDPAQRPCYECGGRMVEARLVAQGGPSLVRLGTSGMFGASSLIRPRVCMICGAVRLYAAMPDHLEP